MGIFQKTNLGLLHKSRDRQSLLALRFLNWYAFEKKCNIQHARSSEGEKKVGNYKLDGWITRGAEPYGIEVNGEFSRKINLEYFNVFRLCVALVPKLLPK